MESLSDKIKFSQLINFRDQQSQFLGIALDYSLFKKLDLQMAYSFYPGKIVLGIKLPLKNFSMQCFSSYHSDLGTNWSFAIGFGF
jgi:hypothetical protein